MDRQFQKSAGQRWSSALLISIQHSHRRLCFLTLMTGDIKQDKGIIKIQEGDIFKTIVPLDDEYSADANAKTAIKNGDKVAEKV